MPSFGGAPFLRQFLVIYFLDVIPPVMIPIGNRFFSPFDVANLLN